MTRRLVLSLGVMLLLPLQSGSAHANDPLPTLQEALARHEGQLKSERALLRELKKTYQETTTPAGRRVWLDEVTRSRDRVRQIKRAIAKTKNDIKRLLSGPSGPGPTGTAPPERRAERTRLEAAHRKAVQLDRQIDADLKEIAALLARAQAAPGR